MKYEKKENDVDGFCILKMFLFGVAASAVIQLFSYFSYGEVYEGFFYRLPMVLGGVVFFISMFLSERKSLKLKKLSRVLYYFCCLAVGFVTFSFLFMVSIGK